MASSDLMITSQADFALNLLRNTDYGNSTVMSIISISIALGMTLLGAKENTAQEIRNTIAKGVETNAIHRHFSNIQHLAKTEYKDAFKIANKIYVSDDTPVLPSYTNDISKYYDGNFQFANFMDKDFIVKEVNDFVARSTENEITEIVDASDFDEDVKMILINAIFFEKKWAKPLTRIRQKQSFFASKNDERKITMLEEYLFAWYRETSEFQLLALHYDDHKFRMFFLLPRERDGLEGIIKDLNGEKFIKIMASADSARGNVVIPQFSISATFELRDSLKKLNMIDAFSGRANFSGMTYRPLFISKVRHKAEIKVTEFGTKAAAVTMIRMNYVNEVSSSYSPPRFDFRADHPFLYFIADNEHNIYFIGTFFG